MSIENKKNILLVEDDVLIAMNEKMDLEDFGYNVTIVHSGEKAIETINSDSKIDLILMDIDLGKGMDGTQAADIILENHSLPVIFVSSHTEPDIVMKTEKITSYGYIVKNSSTTVFDASIKMAFKLFNANKVISSSEKRYRDLLTNLDAGIVIHDADTSIILNNPRASELLGLSDEQMKGKLAIDPEWNFLTEKGTPLPLNDYPVNRIISLGRPIKNHVYGVSQPDKKDITWLMVSGFPAFNDNNQITEILISFIDITNLKNVKSALDKSENITGTILDSIPQTIFWKDINSRYLGCNKVFAKTVGCSNPDDVIGKTDFDLPWPKPDAEAYRDDDQYVMKNNTAKKHIVEEVQDSEGSRMWVDTTKIPLLNDQGDVYGVLGVYDDITERKKADEELSNIKLMLEQTFEQSPIPMVLVSMPDKIYRIINSACLEFLGMENEPSYIGTSLMDFVPKFKDYDVNGNIGDVRELPLARALKGQTTTNEERKIVRADGTARWALVSATPIYNKPGEVIAGYLAMNDITDLKDIEVEMTRKNTLFETLLSNLQVGIYMIEVPSGIPLLANEKSFDLIGRGIMPEVNAESISRIYDVYKSDTDEMYPNAELPLVAAMKGESKHVDDMYVVKPDGSKVPLEVYGSPILDEYGNIWAALVTFQDISEHKEMERQLLKIKELHDETEKIGSVGGWEFDVENMTQTWTEGTFDVLEIDSKDGAPKVSDGLTFLTEPYIEMAEQAIKLAIEKGESYDQEWEIITGKGKKKWVHSVGNPYCENGKTKSVSGFFQNITERKLAENEIKRQLAEKSVLLKEVHHRIKNNIASIESMLKMQLRSVDNPEVISTLKDVITKVSGMRLLYDTLLINEDYEEPSIKNYIESLIDAVISLFPDSSAVTCNKHIENFSLSASQIFPLGIIINELLTNIMKYAFDKGKSGKIDISLSCDKNRVKLVIQDNGKGLPKGFDISKSKGFGIMLVNIFSKQLNAVFDIKNHNGTMCTLIFDV